MPGSTLLQVDYSLDYIEDPFLQMLHRAVCSSGRQNSASMSSNTGPLLPLGMIWGLSMIQARAVSHFANVPLEMVL